MILTLVPVIIFNIVLMSIVKCSYIFIFVVYFLSFVVLSRLMFILFIINCVLFLEYRNIHSVPLQQKEVIYYLLQKDWVYVRSAYWPEIDVTVLWEH